jgi:hypothetical protein
VGLSKYQPTKYIVATATLPIRQRKDDQLLKNRKNSRMHASTQNRKLIPHVVA